MPYESLGNRRRFSHLEAVGRLVCGIAPWLELGPDNTPEGKLREKYINLTVKGLKNAVNPEAPDYLVFGEPSQPLVDAAFLAQGLLRAPKQLWGNLDPQAKEWMITELSVAVTSSLLKTTGCFLLRPSKLLCWSLQENVIWNGCCME